MIIYKHAKDLTEFVVTKKKADALIGFVPTMGALHNGHIALVERSKKENTITVCSIFVNPTQFNDPKDFEKYPNTIENDIYLLEQAGCDVLLLPSVQEMYPKGLVSNRHYELEFLETILEGKYRPGHFQGVCMIVHCLLEIVQPHFLYLGQKDYQQCMVITQLAKIIGGFCKVIICDTMREDSGLAMSSRNMRLNDANKTKATTIYKTLWFIKTGIKKDNVKEIKEAAFKMLTEAGFRVDYVEIANAKTLQVINNWDGQTPLVALAAAFLGEVRLIDNLLL